MFRNVKTIMSHKNMILGMSKREILNRYHGSVLGILWSFITPLTLLAVYTFVFSVVFQARWGESAGSRTEFAVVLFLGLIIYNLFAEMLNRSPGMILANVNLVKKVVFPLEVLPVIALASTLFNFVVSFLVWLMAYAVFFGAPPATAPLFLFFVLPLCLMSLGASWFLASLGVYLRDIGQSIGLATTVLLFMSPIFYPVSVLPPEFQTALNLNPLTFIIEQSRGVLIWGRMPDMPGLLLLTIAAFAFAVAGFAWFQKTRGGFADVL